eukprot:5329534-Pleurochrysis_carterae.AAC.5
MERDKEVIHHNPADRWGCHITISRVRSCDATGRQRRGAGEGRLCRECLCQLCDVELKRSSVPHASETDRPFVAMADTYLYHEVEALERERKEA